MEDRKIRDEEFRKTYIKEERSGYVDRDAKVIEAEGRKEAKRNWKGETEISSHHSIRHLLDIFRT